MKELECKHMKRKCVEKNLSLGFSWSFLILKIQVVLEGCEEETVNNEIKYEYLRKKCV